MAVITAEALIEEILAKMDELEAPPQSESDDLPAEFRPRLGQAIESFLDDEDEDEDDE